MMESYPAGVADWGQARACRTGEPVELTVIIAGLLLTVAGLVVLGGLVLRVGVAHHRDLLRPATQLAGRLPRWPRRFARRGPRFRRLGRVPAEGALVLSLILGLAAVALAAAGVGKLVDDVTDGDGVAVLDHPVARFVAAHRAPPLTSVMEPVSSAGGPAGMAVIALAVGLLLGIAWRSRAPVLVLAVTCAGVIGLTIVFKAALGRSRPPLARHRRHLPRVSRRALDDRRDRRLDLRDLVDGGRGERLGHLRPPPAPGTISGRPWLRRLGMFGPCRKGAPGARVPGGRCGARLLDLAWPSG